MVHKVDKDSFKYFWNSNNLISACKSSQIFCKRFQYSLLILHNTHICQTKTIVKWEWWVFVYSYTVSGRSSGGWYMQLKW